MDKNLPRVYANPINKTLTNNREYYVSSSNDNESRMKKTENIPKKINEIFASPNHVYKSRVRILMNNKDEIDCTIIGKSGNYLLTLEGNKININNINNIEKY